MGRTRKSPPCEGGPDQVGARVSLVDRHTVFRACASVPPIPEGRQQHMQHMVAERRIIDRWCEIGLSQHHHYPARKSTRRAISPAPDTPATALSLGRATHRQATPTT